MASRGALARLARGHLPSWQATASDLLMVGLAAASSAAMAVVQVVHTNPLQVRAPVRDVDPSLPAYDAVTLEDLVRQETARPRLLSWIVGLFAATTGLLAAVGTCASLAQFVAQRRHETAVRVALGAGPAAAVVALVTAAASLGPTVLAARVEPSVVLRRDRRRLASERSGSLRQPTVFPDDIFQGRSNKSLRSLRLGAWKCLVSWSRSGRPAPHPDRLPRGCEFVGWCLDVLRSGTVLS